MKKVLALTLVLVLAISMSTVAFAAVEFDRGNWDGSKNLKLQPGQGDIDDQKAGSSGSKTVFDIVYGDLVADTVATDGETVSKDDLKKNDFDIKVKWSKGAQVLDEVKVDKEAGTVAIKYLDNVMTTKDIDFKYTVYAIINGRTVTTNAPVVEGTYETEEIEWDDDWFEFEGNNVLKPTEFIRSMEYVFSDDISVFGRALKGVKYKGKVSTDANSDDEALMIKHSAIVEVYHLTDMNVKGVAERVSFTNSDSSLFVYDGDLNYLGKVGDKNIPYANTYYLAASMLDTDDDIDAPIDVEDGDGDIDYEPDYEPDYGSNVPGGGDDLYPSNPHDNPGTGK